VVLKRIRVPRLEKGRLGSGQPRTRPPRVLADKALFIGDESGLPAAPEDAATIPIKTDQAIVHGSRRGACDIEHLGSAHDEQVVEALKAVARQRLAGGQGELELGVDAATLSAISPDPVPTVSSRMALLWQALCASYDQLRLDEAVAGDEVFLQSVLARITEPTSKQDSLRVLDEAGIDAISYDTVKRRTATQVPPTP
jgi:hypothetical protein